MDMTEYRLYNHMMGIFVQRTMNGELNGEFYDVEMFRKDILDVLFVCTDPQDIPDEDYYLVFQEALILLVRDDLLLHWFGIPGLCILHADLMHDGENYYVNKTCWVEED